MLLLVACEITLPTLRVMYMLDVFCGRNVGCDGIWLDSRRFFCLCDRQNVQQRTQNQQNSNQFP